MWLKSLLSEIGMVVTTPLPMYCDNQAAIYIANNIVFHECTKHIEVDYLFIHNLVMRKYIVTPYSKSKDQLGDLFIKALGKSQLQRFCTLGMNDIHMLQLE